MIKKPAIDEFIARERRDFRRFKKLSRAELRAMAEQLPVSPPIWSKLSKHQKAMFLIGAQEKRFAFFADTGVGKTLTAISLMRYFQKAGVAKHFLVLVPNRITREEWADEIRKHSRQTKFCILRGSSKQKWQKLLDTEALAIVDTYPGVVRMVSELVPHRRKRNKNQLKLSKALVKQLAGKIQGMVLDESTAVKNHASLPFRVCRKLSQSCQLVFPMSATPHGKDPIDLWSQLFLVDHGYTLGETLGLFRAAFFKETVDFWGRSEFQFDRKRWSGPLHRILANCSIRYTAEQADLPRAVEIKKVVSLPEDAHTYYERAKQALLQKKADASTVKNMFLRMRQISSGFLGYADDDSGERAQLDFPENPKLESLLSVIESIPRPRKIIVFYEYTHSALRIMQELKARDIPAVHLYGGTKDVEAARARFQGPAQVLLLQNQFGVGLNLQHAEYGLFYESPLAPDKRKQCRRRLERQHSAHARVFLYDFVVRGTVDERILLALKAGDDLLKMLIEGKATV